MHPLITIAGTHSGCGKTTVSLALMAALRRAGFAVQPFKAGPDFIDTGHHGTVTGRQGQNIDGWIMGRQACCELVSRAMSNPAGHPADIGVIEGVMGLFDGASGSCDSGSTAQLASWLQAPVVLVADARSMARSAAALVSGYVRFDPHLPFAGVIFNRVGSSNHRSLIAEAMRTACPDIPVLGFLPRDESLEIPARHLGLNTAAESPLTAGVQDRLARWFTAGVSLDSILTAARRAAASRAATRQTAECQAAERAGQCVTRQSGSAPDGIVQSRSTAQAPVRIGVSADEAFCFVYAENLRLLQSAGAELVFFSPLHDAHLPAGLHGVYLTGGYPELHADRLYENTLMRTAVYDFSLAGGIVYAECGGFMYLMQQLYDQQGASWPMCGCLPFSCAMGTRFRALGYRQVRTTADSPLGAAGKVLRGHEFHYSHLCAPPAGDDTMNITNIYDATDRNGTPLNSGTGDAPAAAGHLQRNTLGSYVHLHFASCPDAARAFVGACRRSSVTTP